MYYLLITLAVAGAVAATSVTRELGVKYVARYFVEAEANDFGVPIPGDSQAPLEPAAVDASLQRIADGPTTGVVTPILLASVFATVPPDARLKPALVRVDANRPNVPVSGNAESGVAVAEPVSTSGNGTIPEDQIVKPDVTPGAVVDEEDSEIYKLVRDTPHRRPDGTAFLPIATQRLFDMRWQVSRRTDVPIAHEIPGHVITNPGTGTMIHATLAGVIQAKQGTFPFIGMEVRSGDVLAHLQPTMDVAERAQIEVRIQQLVNLISLTEKQIERLKQVLFVRYRANKIEAMKVEMDGYRRELNTLQSSLGTQEPLRATADGVISRVDAVVGATVNQGQAVFEIVDPQALWVEAAAYDPAIASKIKSATAITGDGQRVDLEFIGGGLVLSNQAIPLRFRVVDAPEGLSVGTPVTVIVSHDETISGISVPATSVIRDSDGRSVVWERMSAETFLPRQVRADRVAGDIVVVQSGLADGARVVTEGATLLNQVR